jgi:hypothetical protein
MDILGKIKSVSLLTGVKPWTGQAFGRKNLTVYELHLALEK